MSDLKGKVVIVAGGLGFLGREWCRYLHYLGALTVAFDLPREPDYPYEGSALFDADVTAPDFVRSAVHDVMSNWGVPYGLVNAAVLDSPPGAPADANPPFERYDWVTWRRVLDVNLTGTAIMCQVVGSEMARAGRGSIVNVSSYYGMVSPDQRVYQYRRDKGEDFWKPAVYSASKSGLYGLTRHLAAYWGPKGVRVNTVTLGGVLNNNDPRFLEAYLPKVPLGRMARPDEYNGAIEFLLSDASSYMTGANLVLDGGYTAQ